MIRMADLFLAIIGLLITLPILLLICITVHFSSPGGIFYLQTRIGKEGIPFKLVKFRSMRVNSDRAGLLTIGNSDNRITPIGSILRNTKLDEMPQLFNVLKGDMSIVGPRPEVEKYTLLYSEEQRVILSVLPGITDMASVKFRNENEILAQQPDPERYYIEQIIPLKIELNMDYIRNPTLGNYFKIIFLTLITILTK